MWEYFEMFLNVLACMVLVPVLLGIAAGVLYLYGYGIWWVSVTGYAMVIGLL